MAQPLTVAHRAFEALFLRALHLPGPALAAVVDAGFNPDAPQERYSAQVWHDTRLAAARVLFPDVPTAVALHALGRAFIDGFGLTVVGRVLASAAPLLGPERVLSRIPSYMRAARSDVEVVMETLADRHWQATFRETAALPEFVAGAFEGVLLLTGVDPRAEVVRRDEDTFQVAIHWTSAR